MSFTPVSTYRLQLGADTTFERVAELAGYLADLGVGTAYASPMLEAQPGSTHGYDVADPTRAATVLGGEDGRRVMVAALREHGLTLLVDIVPNHMGVQVPQANPWWTDVLRHGPGSRYASFFDIEWEQGPILLPVLDEGEYGMAGVTLERRTASTDGAAGSGDPDGSSDPAGSGDEFVLRLGDSEFPVAPGTARDGDSAVDVHERQHYRLVHWRRGSSDLSYRRFFDVSTLAAVRVEDPAVFDATHREVLRWVREGDAVGLRIDHPDGLSRPGEYLRRLREAVPEAWLLVEKILMVGEALPASWPVDGTTGYDAMREVCGVFVDPAGAGPLTALYAEVAEVPHAAAGDVHAVEATTRRMIAGGMLRAEVRRIARLLRDVAPERAEAAVAELLCSFEVYRSYLPEGAESARRAFAAARQTRPDLAPVLDVLEQRMTSDPDGELTTRIQQTSGMVMAKGVEDTAFYRFNRFVALNEVGGAPDRFGVEPAEFHAAAAARDAGWPATMTSLSTHDTKRSEDVRARLAAVSEVAPAFAERVTLWSQRRGIPEPTLDLLAWQTLVGAWPIEAQRLRDYLRKASKEAKVRTTWNDADPEFDAAVEAWPGAVLDDAALAADVGAFVLSVEAAGWSNSLGQKLLQLAGPGVPDVYQGTELWDNSLVDPDNRRPVDYALRRELLDRVLGGWLPPIDATGAAKLLVVARTLGLRRSNPELFRGYRPLAAGGPAASHVVSFVRGPRRELVAVATRLPIGLAREGGWRDTILPLPGGPGTWRDVLTGATVDSDVPRVADVLARYPVALLHRS